MPNQCAYSSLHDGAQAAKSVEHYEGIYQVGWRSGPDFRENARDGAQNADASCHKLYEHNNRKYLLCFLQNTKRIRDKKQTVCGLKLEILTLHIFDASPADPRAWPASLCTYFPARPTR